MSNQRAEIFRVFNLMELADEWDVVESLRERVIIQTKQGRRGEVPLSFANLHDVVDERVGTAVAEAIKLAHVRP